MERVKGIEPCSNNSENVENQSLPQVSRDPTTQIGAQILDSSCPDLAKVVATWANLSAPLKAAILAIIGANENQKEASS
jgi:hypothetical protein